MLVFPLRLWSYCNNLRSLGAYFIMSSPSSPQSNPVLQYYTEWSERTPYITRSVMVILVVTFVLSLFFNTDTAFGDIPHYTVYRLEVYRIILSPLVGNSLLMLVFAFMFFPAMGGRIEAGYGSAYFLYMLASFTVIINIIFTTFCLIMEMFGSTEMSFLNSSGFWTLIFALITMECVAVSNTDISMLFSWIH